jgi:predicted ester cyclase
MPIPPNSKAIEVSAISLIEVVDGKIKTQGCVWDTLGFMQQIGAVPSA